jgi:DHA1 family putative efflux transporter-like MFS transporter
MIMNKLIIYILAFGAFLTGTAEFVVSGILEIIANDLDVSISVAGQLISVYSISYALGAFFLVLLTAKLERKVVLLSSLFLFFIGNIVAFFSYNFIFAMLSRIILAMSGGLFTVVATNYAANLAVPNKKGKAMAAVTTGFTISLAFGVPIGTLTAAYIDWHYIYIIIAGFTLLNLFLLNKLVPKLEAESSVPLKKQLSVIKDRKVVTGLLTTLFWILGYTLVFAYISPILSQGANFRIEMISTTLLVLGIFAFIGTQVGGTMADKWGPSKVITCSLIVHGISLFLMKPFLSSTITILLIIMIWALATWTTTPAMQVYLISLRPNTSEILLSFNTTVMNIGMSIAAGLGGLVIEHTSTLNLSWIGGVMIILALAIVSYSFVLNRN